MQIHRSRLNFASLFALVALVALLELSPSVEAKTGTYRVAILHVTYSDTTPIYTPSQLSQAAKEIHDYYGKISYGLLDMEVTTVEVKLTNTSGFYFDQCLPAPQETRKPCLPTLIEDAAQAAAAEGFSFTGIDGISVLSTFCKGDWTNGAISISRPGVNGTFQRSYDFECSGPAPGPSGVLWGGWAHEFGHQLEITDYGNSIFNWGKGGHPSGYSSGYDQMDSCYPCDGSAYTLLDAPIVAGTRKVFGGWLKASNVVVVKAPSPGTTVTLTPIEETVSTQANQAIQIPVVPGIYYMVEARRRLQADSLQNYGQPPQGIYDEGIHITEIEETRDPPMKIVNACDTTVSGGCVYSKSDPRFGTCNATSRPAYCWPFDLWHVGDKFNDSGNAIEIAVDSAVGNGFAVTVTRGVPPGHPNMFIVPWLTPPMNTYETVDIWVDSSCNGYESDVGPSGLLYGRRADNTVIGNGDDPCANHENRIYAHVRNIGDAAANNIVVKFQVSNPLGVGVTGSWAQVGQTTISTLAPGAAIDVFVPWTPTINLTPAEIASQHFKFHSCIQVIIEPVTGEIITSDNQAQENFDSFEAVQGGQAGKKMYPPIHGRFFVHTLDAGGPAQTYYLNVKSALPKGWKYSVAGGQQTITLGPARTEQVPVDIEVPAGTAAGQTFTLEVQALTLATMTNDAIPPAAQMSTTHLGMSQVGGVVLAARTVLPSSLSLAAKSNKQGKINAAGALGPGIRTLVAVDFTDPHGNTYTRLARTDQKGRFTCVFTSALRDVTWHVRALWQGDGSHTGAVSPERSVVTLSGTPDQREPPKVANCES
jgi:CARDB protein